MNNLWNRQLPLLVVLAYRLIPCRVRSAWSFGSSTSHLALAGIRAGGGWPAFWSAGKFNPSTSQWGENKLSIGAGWGDTGSHP